MKIKVWLSGLCVVVMMVVMCGARALAAEDIQANYLIQITEDTTVYSEASTDSEAVMELAKGTNVFSKSAVVDGWVEIAYQGDTGFVDAEVVTLYISEEAGAEVEQMGDSINTAIMEYEYAKQQERNRMIWGIVIAALVAGMFIVGIVSAVMKNKKEKEIQA